jgi:hypothetical protein
MTRNPHSEFLRYHYGDEIADVTIQDNDVEKLKLMIEDLNGKVDNLTNLTLALLQEIRRLNTL